jgi:hypothetical protein
MRERFPKLDVAGSSPVSRSIKSTCKPPFNAVLRCTSLPRLHHPWLDVLVDIQPVAKLVGHDLPVDPEGFTEPGRDPPAKSRYTVEVRLTPQC